jgi:hypothetical protein
MMRELQAKEHALEVKAEQIKSDTMKTVALKFKLEEAIKNLKKKRIDLKAEILELQKQKKA